ncbi:hypothetical protein T08_347 [Trichinella sp. T8]|nr:hypothetical protein T08_347 [Trichinella sp. T8]
MRLTRNIFTLWNNSRRQQTLLFIVFRCSTAAARSERFILRASFMPFFAEVSVSYREG